ncbi:uncharacterized protein A4U43_C09F7910 [Asparagus officinalis]|uniref:Ubiquitin carboxyl-terminal hydrolase n=1 Tax=Asparagus officinalis TaxID=4686 RepID=A0A5P1E6A4_ASPOF|nr:uncharacterized protein A4U43_C09F7910 [Asparagus officinalis]
MAETKSGSCTHNTRENTKSKRIHQKTGSSSGCIFTCQTCEKRVKKSRGRPPKERMRVIPDGSVHWICWTCEESFCGVESSHGPGGHAFEHGQRDNHSFAVRLDKPNELYCFVCDKYRLVTTEAEKSAKVESAKDDIEDPIPQNCNHYDRRRTEVKQTLQGIKASFSRYFVCEKCKKRGPGRPSKKKNETISEPTFDWACLDCEQNFCGGETSLGGPMGHILVHTLSNDHIFCARLDKLSQVWCLKCHILLPLGKRMKPCRVKGLPNYGNTCYFNSALQNLFAINRLRQCLANLEMPTGHVTGALKKLLTETYEDSKESIRPSELLDFVQKDERFVEGEQHDSHELLLYLLEELESEGMSFVDEIFRGEFSSILHCERCGDTSTTHDPLRDLSLQVPFKIPPKERNEISPLKSNVPPAAKDDGKQDTGIVEQSVTEGFTSKLKSDEGKQDRGVAGQSARKELVPKLESDEVYNPLPLQTIDPMAEAAFGDPVLNDTLAIIKRKTVQQRHRQQRKNQLSSKRKSYAKVKKEGSSKPAITDDVNALNYDEVCEVDDTNGPLSVERCVALFTEPEDMCDNHCINCSPTLQHQKSSEASEFQGDGVISESKKTPGWPSNTGGHQDVAGSSESLPGNSGKEQLSEDVDMESKSKEAKRKIKRLLVKRAPFVLIIQLKRFTQMEPGSFKKIEGHIIFNEMLDLTPYMDSRFVGDERYLYQLVGIVEHLGVNITHGHYVAYVRGEQSQGGQCPWFKADDFEIEEVSLQQIMAVTM